MRVGDEDVDAEEFDWETLKKDDDLELWLIRVPESVSRSSTPMWYAKLSYYSRNAQIKPKHLDKVEVTFSASSQTACIGTLNRKYSSFDIWSMGEGDEQPVGGEEIKSLSCLLPRKGKRGELYPGTRPPRPRRSFFMLICLPRTQANSKASCHKRPAHTTHTYISRRAAKSPALLIP